MEINDKAFADTVQLFERYNNREKLEEFINRPEIEERLKSLSFPPGRKIYIEALVTNQVFSGMLMDMIYCKSKFDNTDGLEALGIKILTIQWDNTLLLSGNEADILRQAAIIIDQKLNKKV